MLPDNPISEREAQTCALADGLGGKERLTGAGQGGELIREQVVALALQAADRIQQALGLPNKAFSYLRSHGTLDQEHTKHLAALLEQMTPEDQADVLHAAKVFYKLYGDVFRALPTAKETPCN